MAGALRSQDDIEHGIIRLMGDPRIHFAVNCAARSCPVLATEAYVPERLDEQLDAAVRRFIADPAQFAFSDTELQLNKVLDWYAEDFGGPEGIGTFFARYLSPADGARVTADGAPLTFLDYDWTLNDIDR